MPQVKRILVVDDKETARRGLKALLAQSSTYEVAGEATNGEEALQWLAQNSVDVVLMDIQMPLMDGLTATQKLRRWGMAVRVIIMSASPGYRLAAMSAGADAFVSKIESPYTLLTTLQKLAPASEIPPTETK